MPIGARNRDEIRGVDRARKHPHDDAARLRFGTRQGFAGQDLGGITEAVGNDSKHGSACLPSPAGAIQPACSHLVWWFRGQGRHPERGRAA